MLRKIYYSIQYDEIDFPSHIDLSPEIKMLLSGLLIKDPKRRLGSLGGIREILAHPWVRKLKVSDVSEKKIPTPIKIDLLQYNINEEEIGDP
jgi:serine/threonine protein kinase